MLQNIYLAPAVHVDLFNIGGVHFDLSSDFLAPASTHAVRKVGGEDKCISLLGIGREISDAVIHSKLLLAVRCGNKINNKITQTFSFRIGCEC